MSFRLADAIFWTAVACCSIAQLAILRSVVSSPTRAVDSGLESSPARRAIEIAWAVLPGVALAVVLMLTWRAMHGPGTVLSLVGTVGR